ncbi:unnamed protein product [Clonostachys solani]|uniref:Carboxylic ester hydrolase n=1 Tax=Clonostachys solani TaxID=160281 RepID=A0A9P0EKU7_9HYPO|nr:unnamed protein product [Clonostachys solani]
MVMKEIEEYTPDCGLDYLQKALIKKCDADDGIEDGIMLDPPKGQFEPFSVVGTRFSCSDTGTDIKVSSGAATIFEAYYEVPGLGHCYGGNGGQRTGIFEALRAWVETDKVPESLVIDVPRQTATEKRVICPYPP